jgi:hypothetical protein
MNIQFGVYDIFSRIVPGSFYLFALIQLASTLDWVKFDWNTLKDIGIVPALGLVLVSYIIGTGLDRLGAAWHRLFKKRGMSGRALAEFKDKHADRWVIDFADKDWPILQAYIRVHNPDAAGEIERNNALCIMLRNVSLGLVALSSSEVVLLINTRDWLHLAYLAGLLWLSWAVAIRAREQRSWFYNGIFETTLAYRLDLEKRVTPVKTEKEAGKHKTAAAE